MGYSKSTLAFEDVRQAFDKALNEPKGLKITCSSHGAAVALRSRFNYFRKLDRTANGTIYEKGHPMHNSTIYDTLVLSIPHKGEPDDTVLYIEHRSIEDFKIEPLSGDPEK